MSVRRILISSAFLNSFIRKNEIWDSNLPADSNVIGISREDPYGRNFVLLVESQEFSAVHVGDLIPFVEVVFTRKGFRADAPPL